MVEIKVSVFYYSYIGSFEILTDFPSENGESSIQFDSPTRCKTSLSVPQGSNQSKIVVLNPVKSGLKCKAANR